MHLLVNEVVDVGVEFDDVIAVKLLTAVNQLQLRILLLELQLY